MKPPVIIGALGIAALAVAVLVGDITPIAAIVVAVVAIFSAIWWIS